ncbi:MAG: tRNA (adenosine(37)-N6)-dimethylallyltransferase MiaA [Gammaproteobacteria bacterium]|nr:tRNA (adenosine(37)-N6)-dimethylallyltransferase MiaA [Gammaproteobacteria bacterium]
MLKPETVICLMGPTCSGKTDLALSLYRRLPLDIISVDSVMVYRGLDIGTAKPDARTRAAIPHYLIDICDPHENYSAGNFCVDVMKLIESSLKQGRIPLLVGGTMLYYRALQQGLADLPDKDEEVRKKLMQRLIHEGVENLHKELACIDEDAAKRIHSHDPQRIIRALEVYFVTGKTMSYWWQQQVNRALPYQMINIGLIPDRAALPGRIAQRFEHMLKLGFLDEVEKLYQRGDLHLQLSAIKSVGYKQAWQYLSGELTYDQMVERAIIATRQLAKRQLTWLRRWPALHVIEVENPQCEEKILSYLKNYKEN